MNNIHPDDEAEHKRLASLRALNALDSEPEADLDAIVRVASLVCGVPVSLITLIDHDRQWFMAKVGLSGVSETPRDIAFCSHAILSDDILEVEDATRDARFAANPLVTAEPSIRFYAGAPLSLSDGTHAGTLCVLDSRPGKLNGVQREALSLLATVAARAMEGRRALLAEQASARTMQLAQDALLASEAKFRALSEASPLGVFSTDIAGSCVYTNARCQAIFRMGFDEGLGFGWSRVIASEDRGQVLAQWQRSVSEAREFDMEFCLCHDDGSRTHVHAKVMPTTGSDGQATGFVGSIEDVTQRKLEHAALEQSERLLKRTGEVAGVGGWSVDLLSGDIHWSDETCRIHGLPPGYKPRLDEAIQYYAPEARPVIENAVREAIEQGVDWDLELPFVQATGRRIWVRAVGNVAFENGKATQLWGAFQDVTDRIEQQRAIQAANERITLATDSGGIGIWDLDLATNSMVWDSWMHRIFGSPGTAEIQPYTQFKSQVHPEDRQRVQQLVLDAIAGVRPLDVEFRILWRDGSVRHLHVTGRVIRDAGHAAVRMVGAARDITGVKELTKELADQHELIRVTLHSIGDAVITTDAQGNVTWLNPVAERMTGWPSADARGQVFGSVFHIVDAETRQAVDNPLAMCLDKKSTARLSSQTVLVSRDGEEFGIEDSASPIRNERNELLGMVIVFHDVTEQRRLAGEMNYRASHDALTGLVNRGEFETRLRRVLHAAHEDRSEHALMYIDLDQFKLVNDACGHSAGDALLQQVSQLLNESVRTRDTLARLGGDEFAIILNHCTAEQAQKVAQKICDRMDDFRFLHNDRRFRIGTSIGLVPVDSRWKTIATLMQAADTSCYAAKEAGRNRVHVWFDTDLAMRARNSESQWAGSIEQALDENRFVLFAQRIQPLGHPADGLHAEVLLRMIDKDGNLVAPGSFMTAAERFHLATRVDRWVLRNALDWLQQLPNINDVDTLCINLSGQSIGDRTFHTHAIEQFTRVGPSVSKRVCLEITETAAVTKLTDAALFIEQVRKLGVRIALDDFGAGASSFGYLKSLKVDILKIDGQFIKDMIDDPLDEAAVRCFVDVAGVVGVKTVAEFVDRPELLKRAREIGIDYAQGFLLHRPQPLQEMWSAFLSRPEPAG